MKRIICIMISCAVVICLAVTVFAHPGSTDSNGGHYDKSTGEYHYHHGYPAHSHYDMDGDGTLDCPYDFDDRTGQNSGSSSSGSSKNNGTQKNTDSKKYTTKSGQPEKPITEKTETTLEKIQDYIFWALVVAVCCGLFALSYFGKHYEEDESYKKRKSGGIGVNRPWILRPVAWVCTIILLVLMTDLAAISLNFVVEVIDWMGSLPTAVRITFIAILASPFLSILIYEAIYVPSMIVTVSDFIYPSKHAFRYYFAGILLIIDYALSAINALIAKEEGVSIAITCIYFVYLIGEYIALMVTGHSQAEDRNR